MTAASQNLLEVKSRRFSKFKLGDFLDKNIRNNCKTRFLFLPQKRFMLMQFLFNSRLIVVKMRSFQKNSFFFLHKIPQR